jgi:hypothetical protein
MLLNPARGGCRLLAPDRRGPWAALQVISPAAVDRWQAGGAL